MIRINYTSNRTVINSGKAKRFKITPRTYIDNECEYLKSFFLWIPNKAIIKSDDCGVEVKDWYLNISNDLKSAINNYKECEIITKL